MDSAPGPARVSGGRAQSRKRRLEVADGTAAAGAKAHPDLRFPADIGVFEELPPDVVAALFSEVPLHWTMVRMGTHGQGSCLYQSLAAAINYRGFDPATRALHAFDPRARDGYMFQTDLDRRGAMGREFRAWLRDTLTPEFYGECKAAAPDQVVLSFEALRRALDDPTVWAENTAIKVLSRALRANVLFLDSTSQAFYCGMHEAPEDSDATIIVMWLNRSHFEPIMAIVEGDAHTMRVLPMFTKANSRVIMDRVYSAYSRQCGVSFGELARGV